MDRLQNPIENVTWIDVNRLKVNDYNPNKVLKNEMRLLELSISKNGWIQPILINQDYEIIDGFHRATIAKTSKVIGSFVPCCILDAPKPDQMLLTIRMNRAKGQHMAFKMHEVITRLHDEYDYSIDEIAKQIGASHEEINLLLQENVFKKLDIENHEYSKAWIPK
mgnify:FL=1